MQILKLENDEQYIEKSMNYFVWKTRFLEAFCPLYFAFNHNYIEPSNKNIINENNMYSEFVYMFNLIIKIFFKYIKEEHNKKLYFLSDLISFLKENKIFLKADMLQEVNDFCVLYIKNKKNFNKYKTDYMSVVKEFYELFEKISKEKGFKTHHEICENSEVLWGLKPEYYNKIIEFLKSLKKVKCVRIFGSRVQKTYREFSDIDMIFEGTYTEKEFVNIKKKLKNIEMPYIIDAYDIFYFRKAFIYRNAIRSNLFYLRSDYFEEDFSSFLANGFEAVQE